MTDSARAWRNTRWTIAVLVTLGAVALAVASYWVTSLRICRDVAGAAGEIAQSCAPWTALDLLPILIVPLILVFPEIGEITVANVLSLKRKAEDQQAEIDATTSRQNDLEMRVINQLTTLNSTQSLTQNFYQGGPEAAKLPEEVEREEFGSSKPDGSIRSEESSPHGDQQDEAAMIVELLRQWEMLDFRANPRRGQAELRLSPEMWDLLKSFRYRHRESLATIRSVRNSVAHGRPVQTEAINGALVAARKLNDILDNFLIPPF